MESRLAYLRREKKKTVRQMTAIMNLINNQGKIHDQLQKKLTDLDKEILGEDRKSQ